MSKNKPSKGRILTPGVIWGQHRTTELIAMAVKGLLETDLDIRAADIPFVEFKEYRIDDYVERLYRLKEAAERGDPKTLSEYTAEVSPRVCAYARQLRMEYGSLMFNLHDGDYLAPPFFRNIEFDIPPFISKKDELKNHLMRAAKRHGLKIIVLQSQQIPGANYTESLGVDFVGPKPSTIFPFEEVRELAKRFCSAEATCYKTVVLEDTLCKEVVLRYTAFMKDVLLRLKDLEITEKDHPWL